MVADLSSPRVHPFTHASAGFMDAVLRQASSFVLEGVPPDLLAEHILNYCTLRVTLAVCCRPPLAAVTVTA